MLNATVNGSAYFVILWHDSGPLVILEGEISQNQNKVVLSDQLHPVMEPFCSDWSLFQNASISEVEGCLNG